MSDLEADEDPRPLLTLSSAPEAVHDALTLLAAEAPAPLAPAKHEAVFRAAAAAATGARRRTPRLVVGLAFAAACLLGAVASVALFERATQPEVVASADAVYSLEGRTLTVTAGHVEVHARRSLTVRAGSYELVLRDARVAFDVTPQGAVVYVESGEVVQREGATRHTLRPGQRLETAPPPEPLALPELTPAHSDTCAPGAEDCLGALAGGDGLEAETAVYELALIAYERGDAAAARDRFAEYQRRFPDGVLAPEASLGLMLAHTALRDRAAAAAEAKSFIAHFPSDPRLPQVRAVAR